MFAARTDNIAPVNCTGNKIYNTAVPFLYTNRLISTLMVGDNSYVSLHSKSAAE
jgi:hypothetical protein